jgi:hypothetical protein
MLTRAQKRRMGERDLWDVIVNNDDICFKHILPRLNQTDVKFLYDANSETRALIKRAARSGIELQKKFKIKEMSSISTLEFAWNNMHWKTKDVHGKVMGTSWFCRQVAQTNKLELLKWAREEKKCKWGARTIYAAAWSGNLEMLKYCVAHRCPMGASAGAASQGHLECLKYLHEEVKAPWNSKTASWAAESGHLHILEYLVERKYDQFHEDACAYAAKCCHLDCLKYLHETVKAPWDSRAVRKAFRNANSECLDYLLDNNCPVDHGWEYADSEGSIYRIYPPSWYNSYSDTSDTNVNAQTDEL